jgi:hypothetical protein
MKRKYMESRKGRRGRKWFPSRERGGVLLQSLGTAPREPAIVSGGFEAGLVATLLRAALGRVRGRK